MRDFSGGSDGLARPSQASSLPMNHSDPLFKSTSEEDFSNRDSSVSTASPGYYSDRSSTNHPLPADSCSPFAMSPWNNTSHSTTNPFSDPNNANATSAAANTNLFPPGTGLVGSLVREEGHIYSLAAIGDLLYTGSDSKNIRVWKDQKEHSGFKSSSGLVKAIVISSDHRIFTGHQDGKIRVWKASPKNPRVHKRLGTLPRLKDFLKSSINPSNYVEARRKHRRSAVWIKHSDAISCLCLSTDQSLLYSGSWDRTLKVWRVADSRCLESVNAHDDAVNAVVTGVDGQVFTGSADGTVKVWKKEIAGGGGGGSATAVTVVRHVAAETLLKQECAVTALAINAAAGTVYCGSSDGVVNLWEKGLRHGGVLRGHKLAVLCLAAAGSLLFSGSADKTICIWGREAGGAHSCLSVLTGHGGPVKCLAVEAEVGGGEEGGKMWVVYSGSLDKSVKVWKVSDELADQSQCGSEGIGGSSYRNAGPPRFDMY